MENKIISITALRMIGVLLDAKGQMSVRELAKEAGVSLGKCSYYVNALADAGYLRKKPKVKLENREAVYILSFCHPLRLLEKRSFDSLERAEYLIKKVAGLAEKNKMAYAFTHLAGAELISPYVVPNEVYCYVRKEELEKWDKVFQKNNIYPSKGGKVHLVVSEINPFYAIQNIRGIKTVSNFLLFADLYSCGGREREAAKYLSKTVGLNV